VPPSNSTPVHNRAEAKLLVISQHLRSALIIDPTTLEIESTVPTCGDRPHEAVVSADGRLAYIPIYGDGGVGTPGTDGQTIEILDLATDTIVDEIDLKRPSRPHCIRLGPDGLLYLTSEVARTVDIIDPSARQLITSIPTQQDESHMLVLTRDGKRAYTSNVCAGSVTVLDLQKRQPITVIPVAQSIQRIAISTDDSMLFTTDQHAPRVAVIDTHTNTIREWIALPSIGYATLTAADGKSLLVSLFRSSQVAKVDLATMQVTNLIDVPAGPIGALFDPMRPRAYITCFFGGKVAVLNWQEFKLEKLIDTETGADGLAWASAIQS
jgi:DNA-binding beta-propeller fold protein YncE